MNTLRDEIKQKTYVVSGVSPAHDVKTRKIANSPIGYEICLAELLCKCCDEDNLPPETLCQSLLSAHELITMINSVSSDIFVSSVFVLYLDQVYFDVEEPIDGLTDDESVWSWIDDMTTAIELWSARVKSSVGSTGLDWDAEDVETEAHYMIKVVVPAIDHLFACYAVPDDRKERLTKVAEVLSRVASSVADATVKVVVASCIGRMNPRGISLPASTGVVGGEDLGKPLDSSTVDLIALFTRCSAADSDLRTRKSENRQVQNTVDAATTMLHEQSSQMCEIEFHRIVDIIKDGSSDFKIKEDMVRCIVDFAESKCLGKSSAKDLKLKDVQMMLMSICRMLRHTIEENNVRCRSDRFLLANLCAVLKICVGWSAAIHLLPV